MLWPHSGWQETSWLQVGSCRKQNDEVFAKTAHPLLFIVRCFIRSCCDQQHFDVFTPNRQTLRFKRSDLQFFFIMNNSVSPGLAWMVIPRTRSFFSLGSLVFQSWRMFVALCSIPSLTSAFIFIFMPESPKFLVEVCKKHSFHVLNRLFFSVWF